MPITCPITIRAVQQKEFAEIDYRVMRHAFDSQNDLGRICDELIYQNDLAARLTSAGLGPIHTELPITVTHRAFSKTYWLDLVVCGAAVYELKTADALVGEHETQVLNYLFLHGLNHGKLINFRPPQVETRFVNTHLTPEKRAQFDVDTRRWREEISATRELRSLVLEMLRDWGCFLDFQLYTEAITHFLGGETKVLRAVPLKRNGTSLGSQRIHLLTSDAAFRLTALVDEAHGYEKQLRSFLGLTPLRVIHWINLARHQVQFVTLHK